MDLTNVQPPEVKSKFFFKQSYLMFVLIALLIFGGILASLAFKNISDKVKKEQKVVSENKSFVDPHFFYYTKQREGESENKTTQYKIFKLVLSPNSQPQLIKTLTFSSDWLEIITNSGRKDMVLFLENLPSGEQYKKTIYSIDLSQPNSELKIVHSFTDRRMLLDAKFIDNGKSIAYISGVDKNRYEEVKLTVVSLDNPSKSEEYLLFEKMSLFAIPMISGINKDSNIIYVEVNAGDGGEHWTTLHKLDRLNKVFEEIAGLPEGIEDDMNPRFSKYPIIRFSGLDKIDNDNDFEGDVMGDFFPCLRDDARVINKYKNDSWLIEIIDLEANKITEAFHNSLDSNDLCKTKLSFSFIKWLNDSHLAFKTLFGVYSLDINTAQKELLYKYKADESLQGDIKTGYSWTKGNVLDVNLPYIIFEGARVVNIINGEEFYLGEFIEGEKDMYYSGPPSLRGYERSNLFSW